MGVPRVAVPLHVSAESFRRRDAGAAIDLSRRRDDGHELVGADRLPRPAAEVRTAIKRALDNVIAEMSNWEPESDLSRFNRAPIGVWQELPADLAKVLDAALAVAGTSRGAFDPTAGALVDLGGSDLRAGATCLPKPISAAAPVGWQQVERAEGRARRTGDVQLDLSGIAKGFGVDAMARALYGLGIDDFLAEIGGELVGAGVKPDGEPWWVDLEAPPGARIAPLRVALHDLAVATSGDYRRFFETGGRRYAHTIDPWTRRPVANGIAAATVLHPSCMLADAWATALTVLGPDEGFALAVSEGLAARLIARDRFGYREMLSPALEAMLD